MKDRIAIVILILTGLLTGNTIYAQSRAELAEEIIAANPSLHALRSEQRADLARIPQVGQLPDPEIGVGVYPFPVETRLGPQQARLSATQMFPWFGTRAQEREVASAQAAIAQERIEAEALALLYQSEQAYLELYELRHSQQIISKNMELLRTLEQLSLAKVKSGQATTADVLLVQLKMKELERELGVLQLAEASPLAKINQLRHRSADTPFELTDSLRLVELRVDQDSLLTYLATSHPKLRMLNQQQEVARQMQELNSLQAKPSLGLGLDYIVVSERTDLDPSRNGRDIVQIRASVKVPLFREQYAAREQEEQLRIEALAYQQQATLDQFATQLKNAYTRNATAQFQYESYEQQRELTASAIRVLGANYRSGDARSFTDLLRLEMDLVAYQRQILSAIVESHRAHNEVRRLLGKIITTTKANPNEK